MLNFSWLAQKSTGRRPWLRGLLPQIQTLVALLGISVAITAGLWLWMGAIATASAMLPVLVNTALAVVGMTLLNFWFSREINTFMLSTREVRDNFKFDKENPTDLRKMVDHVRCELNTHFRKIYGKSHVDIPMPRLLTFTDHHFKIVTVPGRNPGKAAICISTGALNSHETNLNQRQLAALLQMEMVKIYLRRGVSGTIVAMGMDLLATLENMREGNLFYKIIGFLAGPLQFFLLVQRAVSRSYEYEAALTVTQCGRGIDLIDAIDYKVAPSLFVKPTFKVLNTDQIAHQRVPYNGFMKWLIGPIANWIDRHEYATDDKTGYRIMSLPDILVRELGYYINELFDPKPRSTNLKGPLRESVKGYNKAKNQADLNKLYQKDIEKNQTLFKKIPKASRYAPISPDGDGYVKPFHDHHHHHGDKGQDLGKLASGTFISQYRNQKTKSGLQNKEEVRTGRTLRPRNRH